MNLTRTSPAYDLHIAAGAQFREKARWSRVDWYASNAGGGDATRRPEGPAADSWSPAVEAEHRATRERVGLFDLTSFGKIEVSGPGAQALLSITCANDVTRPTGRVTYTQMLDDSGGVVADVTAARIDEDRFLVVTGTSALEHDLGLLRSHALGGDDVAVLDVTGGWCCFGLWGPAARETLAPLVDISLDTASFPYMSTRAAHIGGVAVRLSRVTFVGELGWELYAPTEYGRSLYQVLAAAVAESGGLRCGYKAIDSLRAEKGYLYLGADLRADRTPIEAGLSRFVRAGGGFVGGPALVSAGESRERLGSFTLDESRWVLAGGETVVLPDSTTTTVTSAGLGHTLDKVIGFAYLPVGLPSGTALRVLVEGVELMGTVREQPLYDPNGARINS